MTSPYRQPKQFVLCFDGTGNKFAGDESDTNLLKIYRMLDRSQSHQFHYYQPGIGTYVSSHSLGSKGRLVRIQSAYKKAKDAALGSSFDEHVLGGYKFLMRYYSPGDNLYFFGFSRGSYTARFLAEMLDYIGLLQPGNEELIRFAWKTFAKWQQRRDNTDADKEKRHKLFSFMRAFRETFSRPVSRIKFLGLFDTVNSVPVFENAWMERSKFPYTAHSSACIIRHAVSIDERRAKFRQDLISEVMPPRHVHGHRLRHFLSRESHEMVDVPNIVRETPENEYQNKSQEHQHPQPDEIQRYRPRTPRQNPALEPSSSNQLLSDRASLKSGVSGASLQVPGLAHETEKNDNDQDIAEVWFPGQHGDVGGGWKANPEDPWPLSQIPLVWMVKEAQLAGLEFDRLKLQRFNCDETVRDMKNPQFCKEHPTDDYLVAFNNSVTQGVVHDTLTYGGGVSMLSTFAWRIMEYMPFRRMDLQPDGSWRPIRWPLPCGEVRDIPDSAEIHASVIRRMKIDKKYRPGNVIIGGGGRGVKEASEKDGIGEWVVCKHDGDPVRETFVRKNPPTICRDIHN
ncbi:hypothetical protein N7474_009000 [Penicillium riverlandense]|uniref:uncharacterized protein n=1 Tax=Penicillium riverlandense TaxID=1903569 RepID=UPI0025472E0E|nr:uncharacterized protein N7474_009000 [Penicillium riverlandense]KAJ5807731.1 hypothetical protein N7474_009000 [Penicillium riverlandense]